jgi:hypothetical protein
MGNTVTIQTAGWKIFNIYYLVKIPAAYVYSEAEIEQFGTPTTTDRNYDMQLAKELRTVYKTINDIVEYINMGVDVVLVDYHKAQEIYDIIAKHLIDLGHYLRNQSYNALRGEEHEAKLKRLMDDSNKLIATANVVYPVGKRTTKDIKMDTSLFNFFNDSMAIPAARVPAIGFNTVKGGTPVTPDSGSNIGEEFSNLLCENTTRRLQQWRV